MLNTVDMKTNQGYYYTTQKTLGIKTFLSSVYKKNLSLTYNYGIAKLNYLNIVEFIVRFLYIFELNETKGYLS